MYAIRAPRNFVGIRADGMYIKKKTHTFTDHPPHAQLFHGVQEAMSFIQTWREQKKVQIPENMLLFIVKVETEVILKRQVFVSQIVEC